MENECFAVLSNSMVFVCTLLVLRINRRTELTLLT